MTEKAKPADGSGGHRKFLVSDWKPHQKNTLKGFFTLILPSGLVIHNCMLHEKGDSHWIGLPSQKYTKDDGAITYSPLIEFASRDTREKFQSAALEAVTRHLAVNRE